ncbi:MAG: phosphotransferase family protein [Acidobacteriota bacterium]|nr:phosphotransferase family protein [Acidobacteriota bacterium]
MRLETMVGFEDKLNEVLASAVEGFRGLTSAERLSGGASQETYRVVVETDRGEEQLALRRAAGGGYDTAAPGRPGLATEARLFDVAREAGVPEPRIHRVLESQDGIGDGFLMEWLDGETLGARIVRSPELESVRPLLAFQCGEILARIHAIDVESTGLDALLERRTPSEFIERTWDNYRAFETPQPMIDFAGRWLLENLPADSHMSLVHNDFRNGNLMVTPEGVAAVLDWETAHIGDPMRDLGWICTNSWRFGRSDLPVGGFGRYEDLFAGYESVSGVTVDPKRVHYWEVFGSFWWAVGCLGMAQAYRTGPDPSVERPAIGRRSSECQVDCVNLLIPGPVELVEATDASGDDLPRIDELIVSVRDFLREEVMEATAGRVNFLARVAANSLDIVDRDFTLGHGHRRREGERLRALLGSSGELEDLRWLLVGALRDGTMPLEEPALVEHLRTTVVNQAAIDQPRYSGFRQAVER